MKFSEAIRAGKVRIEEAGLRQIRGSYVTEAGCCTAGMAFVALDPKKDLTSIALDVEVDSSDRVAELNGFEYIPHALLPDELRERRGGDGQVLDTVIFLNDTLDWSADRIATYLENIGR